MRASTRGIIIVAGAVVSFMATMSPEQAVSNIGSWLRYFGWENIPSFLAYGPIDSIVLGAGLFLVVSMVALWAFKKRPPSMVVELGTKNLVILGLILIAVGAVVGTFGGVLLHQGLTQQGRPTGSSAKTSVNDTNPMIWRKLTDIEREALLNNLKNMADGKIWVTCESSDCFELAQDFVNAFNQVGWAQPWHGRSAGLDGMDAGINIGPNTQWSQSLKEAIESATYLQPTVKDTLGPFSDPTITLLAIGPKSLHGAR